MAVAVHGMSEFVLTSARYVNWAPVLTATTAFDQIQPTKSQAGALPAPHPNPTSRSTSNAQGQARAGFPYHLLLMKHNFRPYRRA